MDMLRLAGRTCARYAAPLVALAVVACAPPFYLVLKLAPPIDVPHAHTRVWIGVVFAVVAYAVQLALVAAAAPAARGLARGEPAGGRRGGGDERLREPLPAALADSVAAARAAWRTVAIVVVAAIAIDLALADGGQLALLGAAPKKPSPEILAALKIKLWPILALIAVSSPIACVLAVCAGKARD